jgi:predicted O-methyltransferase YrrM
MNVDFDVFARICSELPYRRKGMFYSEVFLFLQRCAAHRVDLIIESGVKFGMSTALLAAAWPGELLSIDKDSASLEPVEGVQFFHGDSREVIPAILKESRGRRAALLIDGPKGATALRLKTDAMRSDEVRLVGIHDVVRRGVSGETCHSHDTEFRRCFGRRLDDMIRHAYKEKYPDGPGLAIWEKKL